MCRSVLCAVFLLALTACDRFGDSTVAAKPVGNTGNVQSTVAAGLPDTQEELVKQWRDIFDYYETISRSQAREEKKHILLFWESCWRYVAQEIATASSFTAHATTPGRMMGKRTDIPIATKAEWDVLVAAEREPQHPTWMVRRYLLECPHLWRPSDVSMRTTYQGSDARKIVKS